MSNFKNELKKYEFHLFSFEKMHKINFFFCKLLSFMKEKLLKTQYACEEQTKTRKECEH